MMQMLKGYGLKKSGRGAQLKLLSHLLPVQRGKLFYFQANKTTKQKRNG
jgi:hypothetical protein